MDDRKRISANPNLNPNPKAPKPFWENEMTLFFGKSPDTTKFRR